MSEPKIGRRVYAQNEYTASRELGLGLGKETPEQFNRKAGIEKAVDYMRKRQQTRKRKGQE